MTVGTSQTCTHAHTLPMQQAQPSPWLACAFTAICPAQCACVEAGIAWPAQCASWDIRCETAGPEIAVEADGDGIAAIVTLVIDSASASTQTTARAARERAMRRRSSGKLVQSRLTASMLRIGRRARKASNRQPARHFARMNNALSHPLTRAADELSPCIPCRQLCRCVQAFDPARPSGIAEAQAERILLFRHARRTRPL